jgi:CheY-like chemotaxis protein
MMKVMIVDDDNNMVSLLSILLEMEGYQVVHASQQEAILEGMRVERPDVLLMDIFLPGADGVDVLGRIRSSPELASARVVMTSGMDLSDRCREVGADAFLLKPYTPEQLLETLRGALAPGGLAAVPGGPA